MKLCLFQPVAHWKRFSCSAHRRYNNEIFRGHPLLLFWHGNECAASAKCQIYFHIFTQYLLKSTKLIIFKWFTILISQTRLKKLKQYRCCTRYTIYSKATQTMGQQTWSCFYTRSPFYILIWWDTQRLAILRWIVSNYFSRSKQYVALWMFSLWYYLFIHYSITNFRYICSCELVHLYHVSKNVNSAYFQAQEFAQDALTCAKENELVIDVSEVENLNSFISAKA